MNNCQCCKSTQSKVIYTGLSSVYSIKQYSVVQCTNCDNIYTDPRPLEKDLADIYSDNYMYSVHFAILPEKKTRAKEMAKFISNERVSGQGNKVLEIGCMYGYLLEELKKDNFEVCGVELDKKAVEYCNENGIEAYAISIERFVKENARKFDTIIMSHVLEHVLNPEEVLPQLRQLLTEKGQLIIAVPNSLSINKSLFGRFWGWWQVPVHINHFNLSGMSKLLQNSGYNVTKHKYYGGDSMMILLNFVNMAGLKGKQKEIGFFQKVVIKCFSFVFRYWYWLGNEEMVIVAKNT